VGDESESIADDEVLYRRVPASTGWYSPESGLLNPQAFAPRTDDTSGLSVSRGKYKSIEDAAKGRPGKSYYVAVLRAGDLRQQDIAVEPRPRSDDPGHSELPDLNAGNRKTTETLERQRVLVSLCLRVEGPFATTEERLPK
jgi:hypothetical protein